MNANLIVGSVLILSGVILILISEAKRKAMIRAERARILANRRRIKKQFLNLDAPLPDNK